MIRNFSEKDIDEVCVILDECKPYIQKHYRYSYWMLANFMASTSFVYTEVGEIKGFVSGMPSADTNSIFVWQVAVLPECRGKGIGSHLINKVFNKSLEMGYAGITFSISSENAASKALFSSYAASQNLKMELVRESPLEGLIEQAYSILCPDKIDL